MTEKDPSARSDEPTGDPFFDSGLAEQFMRSQNAELLELLGMTASSDTSEKKLSAEDWYETDEAHYAISDGSTVWEAEPHEPGEQRPAWAHRFERHSYEQEPKSPEATAGQQPQPSSPEAQPPDQEPPHQA